MPLRTSVSAVSRTVRSSMPQPKWFHELQPVGGVRARPSLTAAAEPGRASASAAATSARLIRIRSDYGAGTRAPRSLPAALPASLSRVLRAVLSSVTAPPGQRPPEAAPVPVAADQRARWRRLPWWRIAPVAAALALAAVYLVWQPRTVDLAAHEFRAWLFGQQGFTIWNGQWYGGHHTPAYSVISPPLAWLLGPPLTMAIAAVASAALFEPLARGWFGAERARWGALWFGVASATLLFTARLPFALGVAFGLASLLALQRRRRVPAIVCAVLCPLGSPVAGLFLAMGGIAYAIAGRKREDARARRREGIAVAAAAF